MFGLHNAKLELENCLLMILHNINFVNLLNWAETIYFFYKNCCCNFPVHNY